MKTGKKINRHITRNIFTILFICLSCTLAGCGQKGPLFLPEPELAPKPEPVASTKPINTKATHPDKTLEESEDVNDEEEKSSEDNTSEKN